MSDSDRTGADSAPEERQRLFVEDAGNRRPFMRGIMIHSLMARGVPFEDADRTANQIRDRVRARGVVEKSQIVAMLREILGDEIFEGERQVPLPIAIRVQEKDKGKGEHFSKGVLAQSLLAAAIDPNDAFDVARDIESELARRGLRSIDRNQLRQIAYETLSEKVGPHSAERYLVWREYEQPDRPLILLLGGAAGVGKTSLALEVAHRALEVDARTAETHAALVARTAEEEVVGYVPATDEVARDPHAAVLDRE